MHKNIIYYALEGKGGEKKKGKGKDYLLSAIKTVNQMGKSHCL